MNVDDYLGIQYDIHNNSGLNCWGLVASVYNDCMTDTLADFPSDSRDPRVISAIFTAAFANGSHGFIKTGIADDYAVIVMRRNTKFGPVFHCGVMYGGSVLHCSHECGGVVYQPLSIATLGFKEYEFWQR